MAPQPRTAVLVIHGIGEQRPMETLRGFVLGIVGKTADAVPPPYWSKPDRIAEITELRRLQARTEGLKQPTDFYEFYWAYLMEGTRWTHLLSWFRSLLLRRPANVPPRLRWIWYLTWIALLAAGAVVAVNFIRTGDWKPGLAGWLSVAAGIVAAGANFFMLFFLGDAARYLSPQRANVAVRHAIRSAGLKVLKRLHEDGRYSRIIVVGHSLGSVIAYDLLTHLWSELHTSHTHATTPAQVELAALQDLTPTLEVLRQSQDRLHQEQQRLGNPWRITDLITAGSPLAHALLLLASDRPDLEQRMRDLELPRCPPMPDDGSYSFRCTYEVTPRTPCEVDLLHHGAMFACTRWTNLYFRGDFIGGPVAPAFGRGVSDHETGTGFWRFTPASHTRYWHSAEKDALAKLRAALAL